MFGFMIVSQREWNLLKGELDYWKKLYEDERARLDRMNDSFLQMNGAPPVSTHGIKEQEDRAISARRLAEEMKELFPMETGPVELTDEEKAALAEMDAALKD